MHENLLSFGRTWHFVSEFVSWEFCKFMCEIKEGELKQQDLLNFFREMVTRRTIKTHESEITKHEIVAKFLEEIKTVQSQFRLETIYSLSKALKVICPELTSATNSLLSSFKVYIEMLPKTKDVQLLKKRMNQLILDYSLTAFKILPVPDLMKACTSWTKNNAVSSKVPLSERVNERLLNENISQSEVEEIIKFIKKDENFAEFMTEEMESEEDAELPSMDTFPKIDQVYGKDVAGDMWQNLNEATNVVQCERCSRVEMQCAPPNSQTWDSLLNSAYSKRSVGTQTTRIIRGRRLQTQESNLVRPVRTTKKSDSITVSSTSVSYDSPEKINQCLSERNQPTNCKRVTFAPTESRLPKRKLSYGIDSTVNLAAADKNLLNSLNNCSVVIKKLQLDPSVFDPDCQITIRTEFSDQGPPLSDTDDSESLPKPPKRFKNIPTFFPRSYSSPEKRAKPLIRKRSSYVKNKCHVCKKKFNSMAALMKHHEKEHIGEQFPDLSEIRKKIDITSDDRPEVVFDSEAKESCEKKNRNTGRFHCHVCDKSYMLSSSLPGHYKTMHGLSVVPLKLQRNRSQCSYQLRTGNVNSAQYVGSSDLPETEEASSSESNKGDYECRLIKYKCHLCKNILRKRLENLQHHYKFSHPGVKCPGRMQLYKQRVIISDRLSKSEYDKLTLKAIRRRNKATRKFHCHICENTYSRSDALRCHFFRTHPQCLSAVIKYYNEEL